MTVHLSDVNIFDVSKMVVKKVDQGYRVELWDDSFIPTSTINIYQDLQSDKKVELVTEEANAQLIAAAPTMLKVLEDFATAKPEDLATMMMVRLNAMNIIAMLKGKGESDE